MANVFVIPGHGAGDPGATGYGYSEAERVRALATRMKEIGGAAVQLADFSRDYYADNGIGRGDCPSGVPVIELHMDSASASARGGHVIIKQGFDPDNIDNALANFIGSMFPGRAQLITPRSDLANPNRAAAMGVNYRLLECCFITNRDDLNKFNNQLDDLARGILNAFGIVVEKPKKDMSGAALQAIGSQIYTGSEIRPNVISNAGASFDVRYENNVNVGWGTAIATGKDDWIGEARVSFKILPASLVKFDDLDPTAWYISAIQKAVEMGIMAGTSESTFAPDDILTRAQAVCVFFRDAGKTDDKLPYSDVEQAPWYHDALEWATDKGIVSGYDGKFRPNDPCTRQEFANMLWNMAGKPKPSGYPQDFKDWSSVAEWAQDAVAWCVEKGVMSGSIGNIRPNDATTRAEAAAMITR